MAFSVGQISLDGIALNNSLNWEERYSYNGVSQSLRRTLCGGLVVFSQRLYTGRPITLVASTDSGWFTYGMVQDLLERAEDPDGVYTLVYWGESYSVKFDHSNPPAASFEPLTPKDPNQMDDDTDYFVGTLRLFTV